MLISGEKDKSFRSILESSISLFIFAATLTRTILSDLGLYSAAIASRGWCGCGCRCGLGGRGRGHVVLGGIGLHGRAAMILGHPGRGLLHGGIQRVHGLRQALATTPHPRGRCLR